MRRPPRARRPSAARSWALTRSSPSRTRHWRPPSFSASGRPRGRAAGVSGWSVTHILPGPSGVRGSGAWGSGARDLLRVCLPRSGSLASARAGCVGDAGRESSAPPREAAPGRALRGGRGDSLDTNGVFPLHSQLGTERVEEKRRGHRGLGVERDRQGGVGGTPCAPMGARQEGNSLVWVYTTSSLRQDPSVEEEAGGTSIREQSFHPVPCASKSLGDPRGPGSGALSLVLFRGERQ